LADATQVELADATRAASDATQAASAEEISGKVPCAAGPATILTTGAGTGTTLAAAMADGA